MCDDPGPLCPSAQADMAGSTLLGVVGGDVQEPRLRYVRQRHPVTPELLALAEPVEPTEVFRFAAPCAEHGCQHFDGERCGLAEQIVTRLPAVVERLPTCSIRPDCRWWRERGGAACQRCPAVVTLNQRPTAEVAAATRPRSGPPASPSGSPGSR
jgi:hypothetical protein